MFRSDVLQTARAKVTFKSSYSRHSSINLAELRRLCCIVLYCTKGGQGQILDVLGLTQCYSPDYLVYRMCSLFSQLETVVEIWREKFGPFAPNFTNLYTTSSSKFLFIGPKLGYLRYVLHNSIHQIFDFLISFVEFWQISGVRIHFSILFFYSLRLKLAKPLRKIEKIDR